MSRFREVRDQSRYFNEESSIAYYHLIAKVIEHTPGNYVYAFDDGHKKKLEDLLWELDNLYLMEVVSYCIMSNHVHIVLARDNSAHERIKLTDVALKYQYYYKLKFAPDARSSEVKKFRKRLNSISSFMKDFQFKFTWWFNYNQAVKRRGSLWNRRFKSVVLKSPKALAECMKYVELNPLRAKMTKNPGSTANIERSRFTKLTQVEMDPSCSKDTIMI